MRTKLDYDARNALLDQTNWLSQPFLEFQTPKRTKISRKLHLQRDGSHIKLSLSAAQLSVCVTALRAELSEKKHEQ